MNINANALASQLYHAYIAQVGGKAFNGDPLPEWDVFRADPKKQVQSDAWVHVSQLAINLLKSPQ